MVHVAGVLADLRAESSDVDSLVAELPAERWQAETPAVGWTIAHQIAHLAWTDAATVLAITDPEAFAANVAHAAEKPGSFVDDGARAFLEEPPSLLRRWRTGRVRVADAIANVPEGRRVLWYAAAMTSTSLASARLMETWAHGLDISETIGVAREPTARLRHVAFLGHRALGYSFLANGRPAPTVPVRVVLDAPDGTQWTFGPAEAAEAVTGPALDFCLRVTQRRHRADLLLVATGPVADEWLDIAQAFAGPPGAGRGPRT
jgi:uncharacterized protein (TIGR03084 family)